MHRINSNRTTPHGTSASLSDDVISRIDDKVKRASKRRALKHNLSKKASTGHKKIASKTNEHQQLKPEHIKISSIKEIPSDFIRLGTGFYRKGHHLWELSPSDNGDFMLVRKNDEDHILGYDPEPVVAKKEDVLDRFGSIIKVGSKVKLPYHGKVATGTIVLLQPGCADVNLDQGGSIGIPSDMLEIWLKEEISEPEHDESIKEVISKPEDNEELEPEDNENSRENSFEPDVEPSSKTAIKKVASSKLSSFDLKVWREYWADFGRRVAEGDIKPKQPPLTEEEKKIKRKQRREERKLERSGLPPGIKMPPKKPVKAAVDSEALAKIKEKCKIYEQFFSSIEYIIGDERMKEDQELLVTEITDAIEDIGIQLDEMEEDQVREREDKLSIETPLEEEERSIISMAQISNLPRVANTVVNAISKLP